MAKKHGLKTRDTAEQQTMANGEAIGLIETKGIVAAVEALDAALKAANVTFVEQHKVGSGLVAITLRGDVAAVRAAVDAGAEAGGRVGEIVSVHVIPRPNADVAKMG
jgi:ethanolamine utilization protein EutM